MDDQKRRAIARRVSAYVNNLDTGLSAQHMAEMSGVDRAAVLKVLSGVDLVLWPQLRALVSMLGGDVLQAERLVRRAGTPYAWPLLLDFQLVALTVPETLDVFGPAGINRPECFVCSQPGLALRLPSGTMGIYCPDDAEAINERAKRSAGHG